MTMTGGFSWLIVLGLFMVVSRQMALSGGSQAFVRYCGSDCVPASLFVAVSMAAWTYSICGLMTLVLVGAITATVFITRKDFSFMGSILSVGGIVAWDSSFVVCSSVSLGLVFASVMVVFAAGSVLYSTSNVLHQYRTDQHVAPLCLSLLQFFILQVL